MNDATFHSATLENGLTLIGEHLPGAQSVAVGYFVGTGARDEAAEVSGVSHFLEHMLFKGTDRRSADDINREFDELGARYNAYTGEERTVYYAVVLPERLAQATDLLSDMMRPALRDADFAVERQVILEEIAMYLDRPHFRVFDEGNSHYFGGHPFGNSVLGSPETIGALSPEGMRGYFEQGYRPDNLLLALVGAFDWDAVVAQVAQLTGSWPSVASGSRSLPPFVAKGGGGRLVDSGLNRIHVAAYAPGVSATDPGRYAAAILAGVIGDSVGSRLYWALVDRGLADSASLAHSAALGYGAFLGYLSCEPEREEEVMGLFRSVVEEVAEQGPLAGEWERAQRKLATSLMLVGETPYGRLMSLGVSYQQLELYRSLDEVLASVQSATPAAARSLLEGGALGDLFTFTLGPR